MSNSRKGLGRKKRNTPPFGVLWWDAFWTAAGQLLTGQKAAPPVPVSEPASQPAPLAAFADSTPFATFHGRVIDGYVKDGTVFYDADGNGLRDPGEVFTLTDGQGQFTLAGVERTAAGRIVVEAGGIDIETGNPVGLLMAPDTDGTTIVSPLTTLLALNPSLTSPDLAAVLGLPAGIDLLSYDPIAAMAAGGADAAVAEQVFSAQQQAYAVMQAAAQAEAGGGNVAFADLQVAVTALGAAIDQGAATLGEASHAALTGIVADPAMADQIIAAVDDSIAAIASAYGSSDAGLSLSGARALVAAADVQADGFGDAVVRLAGAKAAASVSQDALLVAVQTVSAGGSYTAGDLQPLIAGAAQDYQASLMSQAPVQTAVPPTPPLPPLESVSAHYQFTDQEIADLLPQGDAAFDALLTSLQDRGMEVLDLTPAHITALAGADFSLTDGLDVSVTGTGFLQAGGVSPAALGALLSPADVTVQLTSQGLGQVIADGDPAFDDLIQQLRQAGMDRLDLSPVQIGALADAGFTLEAGTGITVTGTGFLHAGGASAAEIGALLEAADVTVALTNRDMGQIIAGGDAAFDQLIESLQSAGMDHLALNSNQIGALGNAGFTLPAGVDITVTGTGFLHAGSGAGGLLSDADVTVQLTDQDLGHILQGGDAMLDQLMLQLQASGMDRLALNAGQVVALAHDGFSFDAGTTLSVTGTGFLHAAGVTNGELGHLLDAADTTVHLTDQNLGHILTDGDAAMDVLMLQLQSSGMDHLALETGQIVQLADAHFSFDAGTAITVDGTGFLHGGASAQDLDHLLGAADVTVHLGDQDLGPLLAATQDLVATTTLAEHLRDAGVGTLVPDTSDADLLALGALLGAADATTGPGTADFGSLGDLQQALDGLQHTLVDSGVDHLEMGDELAHALAQANIAFLPSVAEGGTGLDIVVDAKADDDTGTAYLAASLQDMQKLGVDEVTAAADVHRIEVAFGGEPGAAYTLDDLPHFQVAAGTEVDLVVTEDDLAHLLQQGGSFDQLADLGVTDLLYTGDTTSAAYQDAAAASSLPIGPANLTQVQVQMLGLGDPPADPLDPFHKPA